MNLKRSNRTLFIMLVCIGVVVAIIITNTLFLMSTGVHWRSGQNVNDFKDKISSASQSQVIQAKRGAIYDRTGATIAEEISTYDIFFYTDVERMGRNENGEDIPAHVVDNETTANGIAPIVGLDPSYILDQLNYAKENGLKQVEIGVSGKNLTSLQRDQILALELPGIGFNQSTTRNYPISPFSSHLIGFSSYDQETSALVGRMGLEGSLDKYLQGTNGTYAFDSTLSGQEIPGTSKVVEPASNGNDVYLTLDQDTQVALEKALRHAMDNISARKAWGVVMEVETGKILGWGSYPTFSQMTLDIEDYTDPVTSMPFEPGSTMKAFTYAAAINEGVYDGETVFDSSPYYYIIGGDGKVIRTDSSINDGFIKDYATSDNENRGLISFKRGFYVSSNVGISILLNDYLTQAQFAKYLDDFGFGKKVDMFGVDGLDGTINKTGETFSTPHEYLRTGFGQSMTATTLQMAQAFTSLFNDGKMMQPYVVDKIVDSHSKEQVYAMKPKQVGEPITKETADQMKTLMYGVVEEQEGTAHKRYRMDGVDMIAKTGTSQIWEVDETTGKMVESANVISSIVAAAPYDDPKVMVYFLFDSSDYLYFGGDFFKELFQTSMEATNVGGKDTNVQTPDSGLAYDHYETYKMPSLMNHTLDYAISKLSNKGLQTIVVGDGAQVVRQFPSSGDMINSGQRVFLYTEGTTMVMPNMMGWSRKDVTAFWEITGIEVQIDGLGKVVSQDIPEGSVLTNESVIKVKLE